MKIVAGIINAGVACAIVAVGAYNINEVHAEGKLKQVSTEEKYCLQQNIFFEARNQSRLGQVAVAWVTLNRVNDTRYPNTICGVVWQNKQFSWTHDGKSDKPSSNTLEQRAWEDAGLIAEVVLIGWFAETSSPVDTAIMYHANYVSPYWVSHYEKVVKIDSHVFYK